jgi:hypothetical protein
MRVFLTSFAIVLALVAFGPAQTMAKGPGGGGGSSGGGERSAQQHATGSTGAQHEAGQNQGRTEQAGTSARQSEDAQVNPQVSGGAGTAASGESWRYRSDNGRWWYWTPQNRWMWYSDDGQWMDYSADSDAATIYVVARPVVADPLPAVNFSGRPIKITNPATNQAALNYTLDGTAYAIQPGYSQDFREDRAWEIKFSRGANLDQARYGLQSGLYTFTSTDHGWELYRSELP